MEHYEACLDSLDQHLAVPISSAAPGISYANERAQRKAA